MQAYKQLTHITAHAKQNGNESINHTFNLSACSSDTTLDIAPINWKLKKERSHIKYFLGHHHPNCYLTQREAEVLSLIPNRSYKEIAEILELSHRTIQAYAHALMVKLGCKTKRELSTMISQHDFIEPLQILIKGKQKR